MSDQPHSRVTGHWQIPARSGLNWALSTSRPSLAGCPSSGKLAEKITTRGKLCGCCAQVASLECAVPGAAAQVTGHCCWPNRIALSQSAGLGTA